MLFKEDLYERRNVAQSLPCRSDLFSLFVVAGEFSPALLVREFFAHKMLSVCNPVPAGLELVKKDRFFTN